MKSVLSISLNTYREAYRSRILVSVFVFAVVIVAIAGLFGSVSIGEQFRVVKSFGYTVISISSALATVLAGVSLFQKEVAQKTIFNVLSKPVSRSAFLFGKFLGLVLTTFVLAFVMTLVLAAVVYPMQGYFDPYVFYFIGYIFLEILIVAAYTIFFSSISVTPVLPGLFTLGIYLSGKCLHYLLGFLTEDAGPIQSYLVEVIFWTVPDLRLLTPYDRLIYGIAVDFGEIQYAALYTLMYTGFVLLLSMLLFSKRDFK